MDWNRRRRTFEFDQSKNVITNYLSSGNENSLSSNTVWALTSFENNLWIGTYNGGLNKLNKITKKLRNIKQQILTLFDK